MGDTRDDGYFHRVARQTPTRLWVNNPTGDEIAFAMDAGAIACTTNPTYVARLLRDEPAWADALLDRVLAETPDNHDAADRAALLATQRLVDAFRPLWDAAPGEQGFVTLQDDPHKEEDAQRIVAVARVARTLGPNVMAKIPVTAAGLEAIDTLTREGVPVCATEVFAIDQAIAACETHRRAGGDTPFFVTHITGIFDEHLADIAARTRVSLDPGDLEAAGAVVGRRQARLLRERGYAVRVLGGGARATHHFTDFVGGDFHITINPSTMRELIDADPPVVSRIDDVTPPEVVARLRDRLPDFRLAWDEGALPVEAFAAYGPVVRFRDRFIAGWDVLRAAVAGRRVGGCA